MSIETLFYLIPLVLLGLMILGGIAMFLIEEPEFLYVGIGLLFCFWLAHSCAYFGIN